MWIIVVLGLVDGGWGKVLSFPPLTLTPPPLPSCVRERKRESTLYKEMKSRSFGVIFCDQGNMINLLKKWFRSIRYLERRNNQTIQWNPLATKNAWIAIYDCIFIVFSNVINQLLSWKAFNVSRKVNFGVPLFFLHCTYGRGLDSLSDSYASSTICRYSSSAWGKSFSLENRRWKHDQSSVALYRFWGICRNEVGHIQNSESWLLLSILGVVVSFCVVLFSFLRSGHFTLNKRKSWIPFLSFILQILS